MIALFHSLVLQQIVDLVLQLRAQQSLVLELSLECVILLQGSLQIITQAISLLLGLDMAMSVIGAPLCPVAVRR